MALSETKPTLLVDVSCALLWFWLVDLVALVRRRYHERTSYGWWLGACVAWCVLWLTWAHTLGDVRWG